MNDTWIRWSKELLLDYAGSGGSHPCVGIVVKTAYLASRREPHLDLQAISVRGSSSCAIEVPMDKIPELIAALQRTYDDYQERRTHASHTPPDEGIDRGRRAIRRVP